ncbi:substrate-binding domain-containing protein [Streptomyces physcomitrii]|uniref:substrate-binding domain-containing protein n=1 Tax=Streptomyces physcomitrii TaxID=2724184 RepID=UPI00343B0652
MKRTATSVLAALCAAALAGGCASKTDSADGGDSGKDGGQFVIGYSQSNNAEPYRQQLNKQLKHFVARHENLKLLPITDARQDNATQVSQVQSFIQQKVDLLIVSPNEPAPLTPPVEQACKAGIDVLVLDRTVNTDCYTSFIGGDNYAIGQKAGEAAVKALPDGGNVAELRGVLSAQPQIDRDKGFRDAVKGHGIKIVEAREAKWTRPNAIKVMNQWLARGTEIDLVYAHNDDMAIGAHGAASGAGKAKSIKFLGIDGLAIPDGGIRAVQQGRLLSTFVYPTGAEEAAEAAYALSQGKKPKKKQTLPTVEVTKANAAKIYEEYDVSGG